MLEILVTVIEFVFFSYVGGCIIYNLCLSLAGRIIRRKPVLPVAGDTAYARVAILVPAYKEDDVILSVADSYEQLDYPADRYEVIVIADSLQPATLHKLSQTHVRVLEVSFEQSTKAKALNAAFEQLEDVYDLGLICDADNMLEKDFLLKVNKAFQDGEYVIQAQRVAKNLDTPFAILDAANEIIANHMYRKGANALGLSASVIGSGMAFHWPLIKSMMLEIQAIGGFDKVLQQLVIAKGHSIFYLEEARIYDEKVENREAFQHQRRRWLSAQFVYLGKYWRKGWAALFRGQVDYFNMTICQNLMIPRMILVAATTLLCVLSLLLQPYLSIQPIWWITLFVLNCISLLVPIPALFYRRYLWTALINLPKAMLIMIGLLFRLKGANKKFIHTKHTKTGINNPLLDAVNK